MVGTGVFVTGGYVLGDLQSGSGGLLLWVLGGLGALCGGLSYAELSAALPRNGGEYMLLSRIYHPSIGFTAAATSLVVGYAAPVAISAMAFSAYLAPVIPGLPERAVALALTVLMSFVHALDVRTAARIQNATTVPKVAVLVMLAVLGMVLGEQSPVDGRPLADVVGTAPFAFSLAFVGYAYTGWNASVYIAGEVQDPGRTLPRSIVVGTAIVTVLYVALNAAFQMVAPLEVLAGAPNVAYRAAQHGFGDWAGRVVSTVIAFGLVSAVGALFMAGPRIAAAVGDDYPRLSWLAIRSTGGAPVTAVALQTGLAVVIILLVDDMGAILEYAGLTLSILGMLSVFGVIVLRRREPQLRRAYRVPGYPLVPLLALGIVAWMLVASIRYKPMSAAVSAGTLLAGYGLWWLCRTKRPG